MKPGAININRVVPGLIEKLNPTQKTGSGSEITDGGGFAKELSKLIDSVNDLQMDSNKMQEAFLNGDPVELHQVMIKAEEAGVAMELLLEIRDKLVSAYNELSQMPM
ncbi:MAG TPA: flagellar hook-basal body complex protein FliE [candidate division Zixibacteria bacterium]|nr:flagellar hook-basal body complex protein FliE [candidate division Zixibacteria bacterium]